MRLSELLAAVNVIPPALPSDPEVAGVAFDSRRVRPGEVFVACTGGTADGHAYIPQAASAGASAIVGEREDPGAALSLPYIRVAESRPVLGRMAAAWHGFPSRKLVLLGVTGTDGKTTTVNLIHRILEEAGMRAGMISTTGAVIGAETLDTGYHVTTPDAVALQAYLARMAADGLTHGVIEVTSHGLAQHRTAGCEFDCAILTNISHEHLDYHGTFEAYRAVKAGLFAALGTAPPKPGGPAPCAVLNADDDSLEYLRRRIRTAVVTYGVRKPADISAADVRQDDRGLHLRVRIGGAEREVESPLLGAYNAGNVLAALAACVRVLGIDRQTAARGVAAVKGVPGRMEAIECGQDFTALVDFAHTPNALRNALTTARALTGGRVIAVFGSAGLRDREKRRRMAATGVELADCVVLTAEDPRTESLDGILEQMATGARARGGVEGRHFFRIPDRGEALRFAVGAAQKGDVVIACGKGHEQSMCFGEVEYPWDDRRGMQAALAERLNRKAPAMPLLPTSRHFKEEH